MEQNICLIGDVVTDVSLPQNGESIKVRLGGITHSARAFWSMNINYSAKFISPLYLEDSIVKYYEKHGCINASRIGNVVGAPYLFLIGSVKETGNQYYDFILRDQIKIDFFEYNIENFSDCLVIAGSFDYSNLHKNINSSCRVHIDLSNSISEVFDLKGFFFETIFISTSSELFIKRFNNSFKDFCELFRDYCNTIVLKENRGGSRIFDFTKNKVYEIPSITQPIKHSVGVGDAFDACFVSMYKQMGIENAAFLSSWLASEYASTTFPDNFKENIQRIFRADIENLKMLGGCFLPWEERKKYPIYIAAPDFDYLDTRKIDELSDSLSYHNFYVRRPIKENGQLTKEMGKSERSRVYEKDISLLKSCSLLIAVYINDDTGTMIELGYAKALGIPCLVYDPYNKAYNCILTEMPSIVSSDLDEILSETFNIISKLNEK